MLSRGSQLRQSRATQPRVQAGCFSVSIIHRTLTWTTGSLTCAPLLMHAIAHRGVRTRVRASALKVDSGRKIPCRTGESKLRQRRAGPTLYQLSYIHALFSCFFPTTEVISVLYFRKVNASEALKRIFRSWLCLLFP